MKLEIARGLFLAASLGVASLCAAAWSEPDAKLVARSDVSEHCPLPRLAQVTGPQARPDQDLLFFMYGLSQSLEGRGKPGLHASALHGRMRLACAGLSDGF